MPHSLKEIKLKNLSDIRKQLNAKSIRPFARSLPWPYSGMVNDLTSAIQTGSNYLVALGLASYTEVCGRQIVFGGDTKKSYDRCFNAFLEYMGIGEVLDWEIIFKGNRKKIKETVRNGLVHEYFLKVHKGTVAMISNDREANRLGFLLRSPNKLVMVVVPYFKLFCEALRKAKREDKLAWH